MSSAAQNMRDLRRKLLSLGNHFFERLKTAFLPFGEESHTRAHTVKQEAFRMGALSLPSDCFARFGNPACPGVRTAYFGDFGSWSGVLPKNAESLRNSDALMRVAVPRRRGPAGLRDFFAFVEISICTSCDQGFPRVRDMGVSLPSACSACCRNTRRPFVKTANEQNSDFLMRLYNK